MIGVYSIKRIIPLNTSVEFVKGLDNILNCFIDTKTDK